MTDLFQNIVILTGTGLSAESGISTFRDKDGIWSKVNLEDVATPEAFARDPVRVLAFYNERRKNSENVKPNAAHIALAKLEAEHSGQVTTVTQNIDPLHEQAGTTNLIHMHGEILKSLCNSCGHRMPFSEDLTIDLACGRCGDEGSIRPDVVWFGEMPYQMDRIYSELARCNLFLSIGTSGNVYPAAGFVAEANAAGARTVELNLEPSAGITAFDEAIHGKATEIVPAFVEKLLSMQADA
ncbi:MAG: NAD-dependent deacylase [Pseudomonadota bacterium]